MRSANGSITVGPGEFRMRRLVKGIAATILIISGLATLIGLLMLLGGTSEEKVQAVVVLGSALFGALSGGVSWVFVDVADALAPKVRPLGEPKSFVRGGATD
jgi:hypothetical protein